MLGPYLQVPNNLLCNNLELIKVIPVEAKGKKEIKAMSILLPVCHLVRKTDTKKNQGWIERGSGS